MCLFQRVCSFPAKLRALKLFAVVYRHRLRGGNDRVATSQKLGYHFKVSSLGALGIGKITTTLINK